MEEERGVAVNGGGISVVKAHHGARLGAESSLSLGHTGIANITKD